MEAIRMVSICYVGDNNQTGTIIDETRQNPAMVFYLKPEADAEIARLEHQIEVLNADLTRCQESKAAIGDKCLQLEAEVERLKSALQTAAYNLELAYGADDASTIAANKSISGGM